ncbi:UDP-2,3-diacylglucosamine diphosphatase [Inhella sp.]|uniref:UDP-2,3-diacylglucosamine diphosphatase n=1 Tax=Inhella sp. TaxID=1921806 RepID=UPI0035AEE06F
MTLIDRIVAPPSWRRLAFVSDLHLGPETAATQQAFEDWIAGLDADALFILGDLFEAWVGDDAIHLPYARRFADAMQAQSRPTYFLHGNRDFLLGPAMAAACRMQLLDERCVLEAFGERLLLTHGDAQCLDDAAYQAFRAQVRQPDWQQGFLARPLPERLHIAAQMRDASQRSQGAQKAMGLPFADPDAALCRQQLQSAGCTLMLHGHTHRPGRYELGDGLARLVLSDWDCESESRRGDALIGSLQGWERQQPWA